MSGNFGSGNGSFSSIVIFDSENLEKELSECESYADKIINFDLNEPYLRNIKPKIQLKGLQNVHCK